MPTYKQNSGRSSTVEPSFYWYDTETTGLKHKYDRVIQFASQRTDQNLEFIGDPFSTYVQLPPEVVPSAQSILITKIRLSTLAEEGVQEHHLFRKLHLELAQGGTCIIGYNSIAFDNKLVRCGMYRNLLPPYEHEYKRGNGKLDFLDIVRLAGALRRDGMEWPTDDEGAPTYKLENLAAANNIAVDDAHDALADVNMTIALARKLKSAQPRLWSYACSFRKRETAKKLLRSQAKQIVLHVSRVYGSERYCIAPVLPIVQHPLYNNHIIIVDLGSCVDLVFSLSADELRKHLFERKESEEKDTSEARVNIGLVALNRAPILAPLKTLTPENFRRLKIDMRKIERNAEKLLRDGNVVKKLHTVFGRTDEQEDSQPESPAAHPTAEESLYDSFITNVDAVECAKLWKRLRRRQPWVDGNFNDQRLVELQTRLKTRVVPNKLSQAEGDRYRQFIQQQLIREDRNIFDEQKSIDELLKEERSEKEILALHELRTHLQNLVSQYDITPPP